MFELIANLDILLYFVFTLLIAIMFFSMQSVYWAEWT